MPSMVETNTGMSEEIREFAKQHLLETLEPDFYASDFSQDCFDLLLEKLSCEYGQDNIRSRIDTVRSVIYKHFKSFEQECEVSIDNFSIKVVNKFQYGVKTAEMNKALLGLNISLKGMLKDKHDYALQENLLRYPEDVLTSLYQRFVSTELEEDYGGLRETIRACVEDSFELQSRDIVIFLRKKLYVRYFVDLRANEGNTNRRYLGVSPEELEHIYQKNFPDDFGDILLDMSIDVINDALNFSRIDNMTFKTKYIEVFRSLVDVAMVDYTDGITAENVRALNGYLLRIYFDELLYQCAEILVKKVMCRDKQADKFLHYYNGEIVIGPNGKKVKKPFIKDAKDNIWNFGSVLSVMTQCDRFENNYDQKAEAIKGLKDVYKEATALVVRQKEIDRKCAEALTGIRHKLDACTLVKNNLASIVKPTKEETEKLREQKAAEKELLEKHAKVYSQKNDAALTLENAKIAERGRLKQVEMAQKSLRQLEAQGKVLLSQKETILKALAKAISFR